MKKLLILCIAAILLTSCKKNEVTPDIVSAVKNTDKKVKIEVDFAGDYQNYQLLFSTSLSKVKGDFVQPQINTPQNLQWTQIITQGNTYNYIEDLTSNKFVVESKEAIGSISFLLSPTQIRNTDDVTAKPIVAFVKVYANGNVIETYTLTGKPVKELTTPLLVKLDIGAYK